MMISCSGGFLSSEVLEDLITIKDKAYAKKSEKLYSHGKSADKASIGKDTAQSGSGHKKDVKLKQEDKNNSLPDLNVQCQGRRQASSLLSKKSFS